MQRWGWEGPRGAQGPSGPQVRTELAGLWGLCHRSPPPTSPRSFLRPNQASPLPETQRHPQRDHGTGNAVGLCTLCLLQASGAWRAPNPLR